MVYDRYWRKEAIHSLFNYENLGGFTKWHNLTYTIAARHLK